MIGTTKIVARFHATCARSPTMRRPLKLLTKAIAIETAIEYAAHAAIVPRRRRRAQR